MRLTPIKKLKTGDTFFRGDLMVGIKIQSEKSGKIVETCNRIRSGYDFIGTMRVERVNERSIVVSLTMQIWENGFLKGNKEQQVLVPFQRNEDVMVNRINR